MELVSVFPVQSLGMAEITALLPLFFLAFGGLISLMLGTHKTKGHDLAFVAALSSILISLGSISMDIFSSEVLLANSLVLNPFTKTLSLMVLFFALVGVILTHGQERKEGIIAEIYGLILFSAAGMVLMLCSGHLLFMFVALEIMSFGVYVLVAMRRISSFSAEAGMKYFILGCLASALFLYGSSLVFGAVGSFELSAIRSYLEGQDPSAIYFIGLGLIVTAMLFKVGAVPFHGWLPDVYQGASSNVTGFMGAAVKFTSFMAFVNICRHMVFVDDVPGLKWFETYIWVASAASMVYGNFVAISQNEIKRLLSFSTIAHTGYLLMGLLVLDSEVGSSQALILYLFFYALSNLGAFAVIMLFERKNQKDITLEQLAGLGLKHPLLGTFFTIFLFSMAGIPITSGFIGKYGLFNSAVVAGQVPLAVIAVLTSVVSVYYYLRVIVYLFMKEPAGESAGLSGLQGASIAAFMSAAATLQFGLFPKMIVQFVRLMTR